MSKAKAGAQEVNAVPEPPPLIPEPKVEEPQQVGLIWADFSQERLEQFYALEDDEDAQIKLLCSWVCVEHYEENPRSMIMVDFFYYNLIFARETALSLPATSALFSILKLVFEAAFGDKRTEENVTAEAAYAVFKNNMMQHCVENPPAGQVMVFSLEETASIVDYMAKTFFRHYKAYQWVFTKPQPIIKVQRHLMVETPLTPVPLTAAILPKGDDDEEEEEEETTGGDDYHHQQHGGQDVDSDSHTAGEESEAAMDLQDGREGAGVQAPVAAAGGGEASTPAD